MVAYFSREWVRFCRTIQEYRTQSEHLPADVLSDEAIVVLTGDQLRIPKAISLLRQRGSPLLIISGTGRNTTLTDLVNQQGDSVINIHEVWKKILLEPKATSTIQNAEETAKIVSLRHIHRLILVTSDYHMPRAALIFKRLLPGIELQKYAVDSRSENRSLIENDWRRGIEFLKYFIFSHVMINKINR